MNLGVLHISGMCYEWKSTAQWTSEKSDLTLWMKGTPLVPVRTDIWSHGMRILLPFCRDWSDHCVDSISKTDRASATAVGPEISVRMCRSEPTSSCIFRLTKVFVFCLILAVSAASETKVEVSKPAVEQSVDRPPQTKSDWPTFNSFVPATLTAIGAIAIIVFVIIYLIDSNFFIVISQVNSF